MDLGTMTSNGQHPDPWEPIDDEPARAYQAFLLYRDMGPERTIRAAYRKHSGNPTATFTPGYFSEWAKRFDWERRAGAWDGHLERRRQHGIDTAAERQGAEWEARRHAAAESDWELAQKLRDKAAVLADFPLVERKTSRDGKTIIEPTDAQTLRRAAAVAQIASALAWNAVDRAMPPESAYAGPPGWEDFRPEDCDDPAQIRRYLAELHRWEGRR